MLAIPQVPLYFKKGQCKPLSLSLSMALLLTILFLRETHRRPARITSYSIAKLPIGSTQQQVGCVLGY
jgi:hypothetical protein